MANNMSQPAENDATTQRGSGKLYREAPLLIGLGITLIINGWWIVALLFIALYGCANGVITIARGAIVAELFGRTQLGEILGQLARPVFIALALTPAVFAGILKMGMSFSMALWMLVPIAGLSIISYWRALSYFGRTFPQ